MERGSHSPVVKAFSKPERRVSGSQRSAGDCQRAPARGKSRAAPRGWGHPAGDSGRAPAAGQTLLVPGAERGAARSRRAARTSSCPAEQTRPRVCAGGGKERGEPARTGGVTPEDGRAGGAGEDGRAGPGRLRASRRTHAGRSRQKQKSGLRGRGSGGEKPWCGACKAVPGRAAGSSLSRSRVWPPTSSLHGPEGGSRQPNRASH